MYSHINISLLPNSSYILLHCLHFPHPSSFPSNMMRSVKMRGFMCQDPTATATCVTSDPRSVIVPRRMERSLVDHASLINNSSKYTRIVQSRKFGMTSKRLGTSVQLLKNDQTNMKSEQKSPNRLAAVSSSDQVFQVVVMRVSLHCQGCASKVKKHLSKMEGVTSFSIDLENRRVTVRGNLSPIMVLESISKVKKAELWPC